MNEGEILSRSECWLTAWVGDELMMMNSEHSHYLSLSGAGGRIWELLEEPRTVGSLCDALAAEYEISRDVAYLDIMKFIEGLQQQKAVEIAPQGSVQG